MFKDGKRKAKAKLKLNLAKNTITEGLSTNVLTGKERSEKGVSPQKTMLENW